ncbi:MAG: radical SAM protein, partial [Armatimonadota bacterium]
MNIKLISPRMSLRPMDSEFKRRMSPPLTLLVLGALTPGEHVVEISDENVGDIQTDDFPDLVGITVNVDTATRAYQIADSYRERGISVILGGIHASAVPDEAGTHADSVCIGEAEDVWVTILQDVSHNRLKRAYQSESPVDPARIPTPRWELIDPSPYLYTNILVSSRGCPFTCEFCYNSCDYVKGGFRNRSPQAVTHELEQFGTMQAMFVDDNFIGNPARAMQLIKTLNPLKLTWHAAVSTNLVNHLDILDAMQESGCRSLFIGFETINGDSLASVRKTQTKRESFEKLIHEIHSRGIMINASLAFGFDHDMPDVFARTLDWLVENRIETMTGHILTPYPGTKLFKQMESEGRIVDYDWSHYNTAHAVFKPKHMTQDELVDGYLRIYNKFYS